MVDRACYKMSIVGLGGTGKTQVALQFAYMVKQSWSEFSVFWVPALSMESFEQACAKVVRLLGISQGAGGENDAKEQFKRHLSTARAGKWLLVVDNVDDPDIVFGTERAAGIADYLPQSEEGVILFTTRTKEVAASLTPGDVLELGPMSRQDASDFLEKMLIKKDILRDNTEETLLDELTCLPLAIAQAAAFLNRTGVSIAKYLQLLQSTEHDLVELMSREFRDDTRYQGSANAVATTWVVSFDYIRTHDIVAADLLIFISCIEWKAIPRSILPNVQSEVRMEEAIGMLRGYSFLVERGNEEEYDVHRLVHLATRIWVRQYGDTREVAENGIRHLVNVFPWAGHHNRTTWSKFLPHALRFLEDKQDSSLEQRSQLCFLVGTCLIFDWRFQEAVRWLEESCEQRKELDESDSKRLLSQLMLASAYGRNGQVKDAVELLEHVVAIQTRVPAEDSLTLLQSKVYLARSYQNNNQVKQAVELLEHAVATNATTLTKDHPLQLALQHGLAVAYTANKQFKQATKLLEHVIAINTILAEDYPNLLASKHNLALAYQGNNQVKQAVELLEHVVASKCKVLAKEHPSLLNSQHHLACTYYANGQIKQATELLEHVVASRCKVLAKEHPNLLNLQHNLACTYYANGQIKQAVELMEHVVIVGKRIYRSDHPYRLLSESYLRIWQAAL
jgi:tetratricopeptide (TPR) repeat protein